MICAPSENVRTSPCHTPDWEFQLRHHSVKQCEFEMQMFDLQARVQVLELTVRQQHEDIGFLKRERQKDDRCTLSQVLEDENTLERDNSQKDKLELLSANIEPEPAESDACPENLECDLRHLLYDLRESLLDCTLLIGHWSVSDFDTYSLFFLHAVNVIAQVLFCYITYVHVMQDDLDTELVHQLLRWRIDVGHSASQVDPFTHVSQVAKVCNESPGLSGSRLPLSHLQTYRTFYSNGVGLLNLALGCWLCSVLTELSSMSSFVIAITSMVGESTVIDISSDQEYFALKSLSSRRVVAIFICAVIPRFIVGVTLGIVGLLYITVARTFSDLLLNCMCLIFVIGIDYMLYAAFVSKDVSCIVQCVRPICFPRSYVQKHTWRKFFSLFKFIIVAVVLLFVNIVIINPMFAKMKELIEVVCGGELNFIYTINPATNMVVAAKTYSFESSIVWTTAELHVLQLAGMQLDEEFFEGNIPKIISSHGVAALLRPVNITSLDNAVTSESEIEAVLLWDRWDVEDVMDGVSCSDMAVDDNTANSWKYKVALGDALGTEPVTCSEITHFCGEMHMTTVRSLCARTCNCWSSWPNVTGFFLTHQWGCPEICRLSRSIELLWYKCEDMLLDKVLGNTVWRKYVYGLKSYVNSLDQFSNSVLANINSNYEFLGIAHGDITNVHEYIIGSGFWDDMARHNFSIGRGLPHPRNLTGCEFLASYELIYILNINLCEPSKGTPLKVVCPEACGCKFNPSDCPRSCHKD